MTNKRNADRFGKKEFMRKKDYEILAAFRYALRRFFRFSEKAAGEAGLSIRQYQALLTIRGFPGRDEATIGEIAEWLQIRHHSAVGLVNRLEAQGFVIRQKRVPDRREVYIRLTPKGNRVLKKLAFLNKQELQRLKPQQMLSKLQL